MSVFFRPLICRSAFAPLPSFVRSLARLLTRTRGAHLASCSIVNKQTISRPLFWLPSPVSFPELCSQVSWARGEQPRPLLTSSQTFGSPRAHFSAAQNAFSCARLQEPSLPRLSAGDQCLARLLNDAGRRSHPSFGAASLLRPAKPRRRWPTGQPTGTLGCDSERGAKLLVLLVSRRAFFPLLIFKVILACLSRTTSNTAGWRRRRRQDTARRATSALSRGSGYARQ